MTFHSSSIARVNFSRTTRYQNIFLIGIYRDDTELEFKSWNHLYMQICDICGSLALPPSALLRLRRFHCDAERFRHTRMHKCIRRLQVVEIQVESCSWNVVIVVPRRLLFFSSLKTVRFPLSLSLSLECELRLYIVIVSETIGIGIIIIKWTRKVSLLLLRESFNTYLGLL